MQKKYAKSDEFTKHGRKKKIIMNNSQNKINRFFRREVERPYKSACYIKHCNFYAVIKNKIAGEPNI